MVTLSRWILDIFLTGRTESVLAVVSIETSCVTYSVSICRWNPPTSCKLFTSCFRLLVTDAHGHAVKHTHTRMQACTHTQSRQNVFAGGKRDRSSQYYYRSLSSDKRPHFEGQRRKLKAVMQNYFQSIHPYFNKQYVSGYSSCSCTETKTK